MTLLSLGCKANQAEFLELEASLRGLGHDIVGLEELPDYCVINTCTVTAKSDYQSRQLIRRASAKGAKVIVTGCYAQLSREFVRSMKGVSEVVSNDKKSSIIRYIDGRTSSIKRGCRPNRSRYLLKIQDGCDHACSYCVIPAVRGRSRSVGPEEIVERIRHAVDSGFQEVVLTGIHIGLYGRDFRPSALSLYELTRRILTETRIRRVRLSSLEAGEVDDRFLDLMADGRVCRHLHVPLQSGDDKVLRLMKRPYRVAEFARKIHKFAHNLPDLGLGTDIITGFPGEGRKEFENTYNLLKELPFSYIHVFPFSERPGTEASMLPDKVDKASVKERAARLRALSDEKKLAFIHKMQGRSLDVLVESKVGETFKGTSGNYIKVNCHSERGVSIGNIVAVRLEGEREGIAFGKLIATS